MGIITRFQAAKGPYLAWRISLHPPPCKTAVLLSIERSFFAVFLYRDKGTLIRSLMSPFREGWLIISVPESCRPFIGFVLAPSSVYLGAFLSSAVWVYLLRFIVMQLCKSILFMSVHLVYWDCHFSKMIKGIFLKADNYGEIARWCMWVIIGY